MSFVFPFTFYIFVLACEKCHWLFDRDSDSSQPHGLQYTRLPCPSLSAKVCSDSCSLSQWCCLTIQSSASFSSFCFQPFPSSWYFAMTQLFTSGSQNIRVSASALVPPMNIQDWFPLGLTYLISLPYKRLSSLFQHQNLKASILWCSAFFMGCYSVVQLFSHVWLFANHGLQHTRLPCPSLSPRVCPKSWTMGQWCHSTISSSAIHFSSYPQSFPASGSFPMSHFFASGSKSIGTSASALVFTMNIQGLFP